jgi:hypothetical protein
MMGIGIGFHELHETSRLWVGAWRKLCIGCETLSEGHRHGLSAGAPGSAVSLERLTGRRSR